MADSYVGANIRWILSELESNSIEYAVLRNYEKLPEIGHDLDLIVNKNQLNSVKEILAKCKDTFLWDDLIEITLWESYVEDFSIRVFKLFNYTKNKCLHIDFFGGYSIWSAPAISTEQLLSRREQEKFYYRISHADEIVMRYMQLACAIRDKETQRVAKLKRVMKQLGGVELLESSIKNLPVKLELEGIHGKDEELKRGFEKFKHQYFRKFILRSPGVILLRFLERIRFRLTLYTFAVPGILIFINKKSAKKNENQIIEELKRLKDGDIIPSYEFVLNKGFRSILKGYKKMLTGGVLMIAAPIGGNTYNEELIKTKMLRRLS